MKVGLVSIPVPDPVAAFKYYTEVLGFVEVMYSPEHQIAIVASPEDPEGTSILLEPNSVDEVIAYQKWAYQSSLPIMVFTTDDIQKEYEKLVKAGVKFTKPPTKADWGIETLFEDTCGNYLQLTQLA